MAFLLESTKTTFLHPKDIASIPREPEPANKSITNVFSKLTQNRCIRTLKSDCLMISDVGRVDGISGAMIYLRFNIPPIILHFFTAFALEI